MNCPPESICIVYPEWYLVAALASVAVLLVGLVVLAVWSAWHDRLR